MGRPPGPRSYLAELRLELMQQKQQIGSRIENRQVALTRESSARCFGWLAFGGQKQKARQPLGSRAQNATLPNWEIYDGLTNESLTDASLRQSNFNR